MKIRTETLKIAKKMHTWFGISAGIFLFICFFAGGLTMFQHDLSRWAAPQQQQLPKISLGQYNALLSQVQQHYPETQRSLQINFSGKEGFNAPMQWRSPTDTSVPASRFDADQSTLLASLTPEGQLIVQQQNLSKIGWLVEQLHETAGIPGSLGHDSLGLYVMGVVAILYFLALLSGLVVLLPTLVKDFFAIRPGKNKKRFWLDSHNVIGISSLPFHVIIAISVIVFAFHDVFYWALGKLAFPEQPLFPRPAAMQIAEPAPKLDIQAIYHKLANAAPEYQLQGLSLNALDQPNKASAFASLYSPQRMLRGADFDYVSFNPYQSTPYNLSSLDSHIGNADKVIKSMFALHLGNYGGDFTRYVYLLFGLGGAYLFYSGNLLWIESRLKKAKTNASTSVAQRLDVRFMANLSIGACLGCVLAIAGCLLLVRFYNLWLTALSSINQCLIYTYYALFLISLSYSFVVGAAKALPSLLKMIALCCFFIPLLSLLAVVSPQLGIYYSPDLYGIDLFSALCGLVFWRFYQQAKSRMLSAPTGSIWCATTAAKAATD
jgi:uncharacterized iron-regulated membrane protein